AAVRVSVETPAFDAEVNILGSLHLCQAALAAGTRKIVFAGSGGTLYGVPEALPVAETHSRRPVSPYGVAKKAVGDYLHYYKEIHGLDYTVLALANVYGPRPTRGPGPLRPRPRPGVGRAGLEARPHPGARPGAHPGLVPGAGGAGRLSGGGRLGRDVTAFQGPGDELDPRRHPQLGHHVADVVLGRLVGDPEGGGQRLVGVPVDDELDDVAFALGEGDRVGEPVPRWPVAVEPADQQPLPAGREGGAPGGHGLDGPEELVGFDLLVEEA